MKKLRTLLFPYSSQERDFASGGRIMTQIYSPFAFLTIWNELLARWWRRWCWCRWWRWCWCWCRWRRWWRLKNYFSQPGQKFWAKKCGQNISAETWQAAALSIFSVCLNFWFILFSWKKFVWLQWWLFLAICYPKFQLPRHRVSLL